jgi:hypothetical protein
MARAVGAAQKPDGPNAAGRGHTEPIPREVITWGFALVEQLAAEYIDEERGCLLHVGHGDADMVYAA